MKRAFGADGFLSVDGVSFDERKSVVKKSFDVRGIKDVFGFDKPLAVAVLALCLLGILFIYSASKYSATFRVQVEPPFEEPSRGKSFFQIWVWQSINSYGKKPLSSVL